MIYLDNAATTWPKPTSVAEAMTKCLTQYGANPGRGSHRLGQKAANTVFQVRSAINHFVGGDSPDNIIFTQNATEALNLAIKGFLRPGDHVIATSYEHNSVRRPLEYMKSKGVQVTYIRPNDTGDISLEDIISAVQKKTK
ncbi:MAG: cysteine desulfurase, partial [Bacilli bacterium]|nr:cysteine desulfurase [Bacilli bacterium]